MDPVHTTDVFRVQGGHALPGPVPAGWWWPASLERVVDGDTLVVTIHRRVSLDLGFRDRVVLEADKPGQVLRLVGLGGRAVDAYELHGPDASLGMAARALTATALLKHQPLGLPLTIQTFRPFPRDKYGRWVASVPAQQGLELEGAVGLAEALVAAGLARWRPEWDSLPEGDETQDGGS